jgi:hypothetical protein
VAEIIRIEDPWSFGRSPIAPLLLVSLCAVVPWPAAPWPAVPAPVLVPVEPEDPAVLPVPEVAPVDDVPPPGLVLSVPEVPGLLMPWPLVPE